MSEYTYFTDRDLGNRFPTVLRAEGVTVVRHADHFEATTPDEQLRNGVALLVLIGNSPHDVLARNFLATRPIIEGFLDLHQRPFIAKVYRPGASRAPIGALPGRVQMFLDGATGRTRPEQGPRDSGG